MAIENPLTSLLWKAPWIKRLVELPSAKTVTCDFCQFGTPWRKATQVVFWHVGDVAAVQQRCSGKRGHCSKTHSPHQQLTGYNSLTKMLWTKQAQPYPAAFAHLVSVIIARAHGEAELPNRNRLAGIV